MKILVTGAGGKAGSWAMRGEQLGLALGATVQPHATAMGDHDVAVIVKRTPPAVIQVLKGGRWAWDIVDAYPQPESYRWSRDQAINWVRQRIADLGPAGIIWPTQRMREDCDTGLPGIVLPHHHRIGIKENPIREQVQVVGYEGAGPYLGIWRAALRAECQRRQWRFVENPPRLSDLDIVIAVRDGGGYVSQHWKSGVKLANAHASGTPFIGNPECGYLETAAGGEQWVKSPSDIAVAFDGLESSTARRATSNIFKSAAYSVDAAAEKLERFLIEIC